MDGGWIDGLVDSCSGVGDGDRDKVLIKQLRGWRMKWQMKQKMNEFGSFLIF